MNRLLKHTVRTLAKRKPSPSSETATGRVDFILNKYYRFVVSIPVELKQLPHSGTSLFQALRKTVSPQTRFLITKKIPFFRFVFAMATATAKIRSRYLRVSTYTAVGA